MKPWLRHLLLAVASLAAGGLGFLALGSGPDPAAAATQPQAAWRLPIPPRGNLAAADAVWKKRAPWGAPPSTETEKPPVWLPAGIVGVGSTAYAVFVATGEPEVRIRPGGRLPDGGKVLQISRSRLSWIDAQGAKHEREMLADPLPNPMNTP